MKFIFTSSLLLFSFICFSQDTAMVEQYCKVIVWDASLLSNTTIDVNFGEKRSSWKDYTLRNENGKRMQFNSEVDALNYLGKRGWKLVNAFAAKDSSYWYIFKKEFNKSDVEKASIEELELH